MGQSMRVGMWVGRSMAKEVIYGVMAHHILVLGMRTRSKER